MFLFIYCSFWGQETKIDPDNLKSVFWKITDPETQHMSYLFGTMHMVTKDKFVMPNAVKMKLLRSEVLFLEVVDFEDFGSLKELMDSDSRMSDALNNEQRDSLYKFTQKELKMDSAMFESTFGKFNPMIFSSLLIKDIFLKSESYDKTLFYIAKENEIPAEGLETMKKQMNILNDMTDETKVEFIMNVIRFGSLYKTSFFALQNAYLNQDLSIVSKMESQGKNVDQFVDKDLLDNRNLGWITTLIPRLKTQNLFIGVGAAHLTGNNGLINLLSQQGFVVEPIQIRLTKYL